jgi:hypothetical protein
VRHAGESEHGSSPEHGAACQAKARNGHRFPLFSQRFAA